MSYAAQIPDFGNGKITSTATPEFMHTVHDSAEIHEKLRKTDLV